MRIKFFTVGGTIDKIYFDSKSAFEVGDPVVTEVLHEGNIVFDYEVETLLRKDSLDVSDEERETIINKIRDSEDLHIVLTHGTDTMVETARQLLMNISDEKVVVLTGSMSPARFRHSDATFNIGCAVTAVQTLPPGVYIAMNGRIFNPSITVKNVEANRFETIT
jgi:L-asparaginase